MPSPLPSPGTALHVSVVTETYPPEINGVAITVARLVRGLRADGHAVTVTRPWQSGDHAAPHAPATAAGADVLTRGIPIPRYPGLKAGLPCGRRLRRLWREQRPDVVHVATEGPLGWSAVQAARALSIPCVSEFRTNFHAYSEHYGIGFLRGLVLGYLRRFHNRCHATMAPTDSLARSLASEGFERLHVVGRGVDTGLFNPGRRSEALRRSWGAGPGDIVVLSVGRIAPEKNLGLLERSAAAIAAARPDSRMVVVGDGPCRAALQGRWPSAVFVGKQRDDALAAHYASGDLLLFPSLTETYGNVTLEAMASGLGVVAFDYGAAAEAIQHGRSGWLAPRGDDSAFVAAAVRAATHAGELACARTAAAAESARLGWGRVLEDLVAVYRHAIRDGLQPGQRAPASTPGWTRPGAACDVGTSMPEGTP